MQLDATRCNSMLLGATQCLPILEPWDANYWGPEVAGNNISKEIYTKLESNHFAMATQCIRMQPDTDQCKVHLTISLEIVGEGLKGQRVANCAWNRWNSRSRERDLNLAGVTASTERLKRLPRLRSEMERGAPRGNDRVAGILVSRLRH